MNSLPPQHILMRNTYTCMGCDRALKVPTGYCSSACARRYNKDDCEECGRPVFECVDSGKCVILDNQV